jgi:HSP20 family protein
MSDEEFPFWWRRRRYFDDLFKEIEKWFEEALKEMERDFEFFPRDLVREKKVGSKTIREFGPFVYGYSITIGPDGKPIIREFGNVRPRGGIKPIEVTEEREPLVDVIEEQDKIRVIAEVPGASKEEINIEVVDGNKLKISTTGKRKYYKEVLLGADVEPESAKATYSNGVLEVVLKKKGEAKEGKKIKIE